MSITRPNNPPRSVSRLFLILAVLAAINVLWVWPSSAAMAEGGIEVVEDDRQVEFPNELSFTMTAESSEDIVEIQLLYRIAGSGVWSYAYADLIPGKRVTSNLDLVVAGSTYLPPGVDVEYYYVITDSLGNTHATEIQSVEYLDGRYDWERTQIGPLRLLHHGLSQSRVTVVSREVEDALSHIRSLLDMDNLVDHLEAIRGVIYNSNSEARNAFPRQSQTITDSQVFGGFAFPNNRVFVGIGFRTRIISHESAHLMLDQAVGPNALPVPSWLDEGFAGYVEPGSRAFSGSSLSGRGLPLKSMTRLSGTPQSIGTFYRKAESVVAYMIQEFGVDSFQGLIARLSQGDTMDQALNRAYGFDLSGLEARWSTDDGPPTAPPPGRQSQGTPWASFSSVMIGGLAVVVVAAWALKSVMRKLRPEYPTEEGLQPWEDPDLMEWDDDE